MTRLKGSGIGGKYSFEASPLVKNGIMYVITGNDDVFALNAKTGEILWEYWSGIDQKISTICCGWVNRGLAMGEGLLYFGQLDANVVALDMKTGKVKWKTPIEKWENGYTITSAPPYDEGLVYSGISGGEFGVRGRVTALDAKTGEIKWRWYTLPGPGERGSETAPPGTGHSMRGGATVWNTPALDPQLGLLYFAAGNCGPDYDGSMREGDNLFCTSMVALKAKTGEYVWHFQQVHHDIWDYDAASPVVLFDTVIDGQPRKGIAEAGRTGWVYILDRTNGKPPIGTQMSGTFTAIDGKTNTIAWQHKTPYRIGGGGGSTVTAGGLVFRGEPDGNFLAIDAKTGQELWRFQTGFGADAPPVIYEADGEQFVVIATGGNQLQGSANGDAVWASSLKGQLGPLWPPPPPPTVAGPVGPIATGVDTIKVGGNNVEYSFVPARVRIKAGSTLNFTNVGDLPHGATAWQEGNWDTGVLPNGQAKSITFSKPGNYYYICTPHPWMYGQVIVE